jgi:hypothetical protein
MCGSDFDAAPIVPSETFENTACRRGGAQIARLQKAKLSKAQEQKLDANCHELAMTSEVIDLEELLH